MSATSLKAALGVMGLAALARSLARAVLDAHPEEDGFDLARLTARIRPHLAWHVEVYGPVLDVDECAREIAVSLLYTSAHSSTDELAEDERFIATVAALRAELVTLRATTAVNVGVVL